MRSNDQPAFISPCDRRSEKTRSFVKRWTKWKPFLAGITFQQITLRSHSFFLQNNPAYLFGQGIGSLSDESESVWCRTNKIGRFYRSMLSLLPHSLPPSIKDLSKVEASLFAVQVFRIVFEASGASNSEREKEQDDKNFSLSPLSLFSLYFCPPSPFLILFHFFLTK